MWSNLPEDLLLAARSGDLNVLIGAGASMDAGLPGWSHLLASQVVVEVISHMLEHQGCQVVAYATAAEALRSLEERESAPDLLLADMVMPDMSGYDLVLRVRERFPRLPVVFMSGYISDAEIHRQPGSRFLQKPFTQDELFKTLTELTAAGDRSRPR